MPRRASSKIHPGILAGIAVALIVAIIAGRSLLGGRGDSIGGQPLNVAEFLENGNGLRDNENLIEGTVDEKFSRPSSRNQLVSVRVEVDGGVEFIPVLVTEEFFHLNIEREQRFAFRVRFRDGGVAVTTAASRL